MEVYLYQRYIPSVHEGGVRLAETVLTQTQEAILKSAKRHFLRDGFQKASLNQIVKDAGFTKGAFYGYYASKEDLFCALVQDTVAGIQALLGRASGGWRRYPEEERLFHMTEEFLAVLPELVDFVFARRDEVILLLKCADGTRYENLLENMQRRDENEGLGNMQRAFGGGELSAGTYRVMMMGYFAMLKAVFLSDMSKEEMLSALTDIQMMYQTGIMALIESKAKGEKQDGKRESI